MTEFGAKCYKPQLLGGLMGCSQGVFNRVFHSFCGFPLSVSNLKQVLAAYYTEISGTDTEFPALQNGARPCKRRNPWLHNPSDLSQPVRGDFVVLVAQFFGPELRGVGEHPAVSSAGWMFDVKHFMIQNVIQNELGYSR